MKNTYLESNFHRFVNNNNNNNKKRDERNLVNAKLRPAF